MMSAELEPSLAQFAARVKAEFIKNADKVFDEEQAKLLTEEIIGDLNKAKASALKALLGIEQRYDGQMEFDHCNARQGAIDRILTDIARPVLLEWVRASFDEFRNSPAFAAARAAAKKAIVRQVKEQLNHSSNVYDAAKEIAHELKEQVMEELCKELGIAQK
jgi:hypothetical protein